MGTATGAITGYGKSAKEAYDDAYEEAVSEHGHEEGYSGYINGTMGMGSNITDRYKKAKNKEDFIEELFDEMSKGECCYVILKEPILNTNKIRSSVSITSQVGIRKWKTRYQVEDSDGIIRFEEKTQGEAIKKARKRTEETKRTHFIIIAKVLTSGTVRIGKTEYKYSTKEMNGKYLFIYAVNS